MEYFCITCCSCARPSSHNTHSLSSSEILNLIIEHLMPNKTNPDYSIYTTTLELYGACTFRNTRNSAQTFRIRSLTVRADDVFPQKFQLWNVWSRQLWRKEIAMKRKKYERKDNKKVNPMISELENDVETSGSPVELRVEGEMCGIGDSVLHVKIRRSFVWRMFSLRRR